MKNRFLSEVQIDDILKDAISTFGKHAQLAQAMEELAELTVECSKLARGICNIENLHKELADVRIMLRQIEMIAGTNVESGQLCIEIAERDALEKLSYLISMENEPEIRASGYSDKAVLERQKKQDEVTKEIMDKYKHKSVEVLNDTCANCIFRSDTKKEESFIDNYWCAKNEVWIQLKHYCKQFVQRD